MNSPVKLSHTAALILQTISQGYCYGFDIMDVTGLPSGTVYPALRRLEREVHRPNPAETTSRFGAKAGGRPISGTASPRGQAEPVTNLLRKTASEPSQPSADDAEASGIEIDRPL